MMRRVDLLPSTYVARRRQRRTVGYIALAGGLVVLLLLAWWLLLTMQLSDARDELAAVEAQNARLESEIAELQRFAELERELNEKRSALRTVMGGDVDWPALLTEVAMVVPGEVWLTNLTASAGQTEGATAVGTETAPVRISKKQPFGRIQFQGSSLSMPGIGKWLIRLASVRDFEAIWLNSATEEETETGTAVVDFDSTLELNDRAASLRFAEGTP